MSLSLFNQLIITSHHLAIIHHHVDVLTSVYMLRIRLSTSRATTTTTAAGAAITCFKWFDLMAAAADH